MASGVRGEGKLSEGCERVKDAMEGWGWEGDVLDDLPGDVLD